MTTPIRADIAEKENAPSPAVKPSPKPADIARGDDDKFVGLDGKVKHRKVVKADGTTVDASTGHAAVAVGGVVAAALCLLCFRSGLGGRRAKHRTGSSEERTALTAVLEIPVV